jgi:hypothetical protein
MAPIYYCSSKLKLGGDSTIKSVTPIQISQTTTTIHCKFNTPPEKIDLTTVPRCELTTTRYPLRRRFRDTAQKRGPQRDERPNDRPTDRRAAPAGPVPLRWPKVGIPLLGPTNLLTTNYPTRMTGSGVGTQALSSNLYVGAWDQ